MYRIVKKKCCCFNFSCSLVVGFVCPSKALPIVLSWPHNVLFTLNQIWMEENKDMLNLNHSKGLCTLLCINLCIFIFPSCCLNPCKCFLRHLRTLCELWVISCFSFFLCQASVSHPVQNVVCVRAFRRGCHFWCRRRGRERGGLIISSLIFFSTNVGVKCPLTVVS